MRTGIFGGTFDPPHIGHFILAHEALYKLELDRLLWVVTASPPHKQDQIITPVEQRFDMVTEGIKTNHRFQISRIEIDRPGPHYAADTLQLLKKQYPQDSLCYLIGGDSLRDLPGWYHPQRILRAVDLLGVMRRPEDEIDLAQLDEKLPGLAAKATFFETPLLEISSSDIRKRIAHDEPFQYFLLPEVVKIIQQRRYYMADQEK